jgi:hypothetical protein
MADVTTTTDTELPTTAGDLPQPSLSAQFLDDYRYIEGEGWRVGLYERLFQHRAETERELEQQHQFLTGDYLNHHLIPRLNQLAQPATKEQIAAFVLHLILPCTRVSKEEKEAYVYLLTRTISNQQPMVGVLELAVDDLFRNSDGFLPTPIIVNKALGEADKRIRTLTQHINAMPEAYQRGVVGLEQDRQRAIEDERSVKEYGAREAAERNKAQEEFCRVSAEHQARYGEPFNPKMDVLEWYRGLLKMRRK